MGCHRPVMLFKNNDRNYLGWGRVGDARSLKKKLQQPFTKWYQQVHNANTQGINPLKCVWTLHMRNICYIQGSKNTYTLHKQ